jgi:hypothetical protein
MRLDYFLIGLVVFSVFITIGGLYIQDTRNNYGLTEDPNSTYFKASYNTIDQMSSITTGQYNSVLNNSISSTDATSSSISGAYGALRFMTNAITLPANIASDICTSLPVGGFMCAYWITVLVIVLTILIIFSIIAILITRWWPS